MKTTKEKMDAFESAIEEFEIARDACADAISDLCEDLYGSDIVSRLESAEPDGNVPENLRSLHGEIEGSDLVESEDEG